MSQVAIKVQNLSKLYQIGAAKSSSLRESLVDKWAQLTGKKSTATQDFWALRDVSFEIRPGEAVGIIGKNGAGKSTLLKILSRITQPTRGRIEIEGRVASLLEVGTGFHPELSGRENVYLNGTILGMSRREIKARFDEIVDFSEVEKFIDTPVKFYSSGMYVRLAFAVAAHLNPEILIVDEVLAVGDAEFQKKCLGKMGEVTGQGRTVLFVSHQMATVSTLCSRGIVLQSGSVAMDGTADQAISSYIRFQKDDNAERSWPDFQSAPGNEHVRIMGVRVVSGGRVTSNVAINQPVIVEIDFCNTRPGAFLSSNIQLFDKSGIGVLSSVNWSSAALGEDEWSGAPYPEGTYRASCVIPGNFLNESTYSINAIILSDTANIIAMAEEAVSFTVHDTGEMRREYTGHWLGIVRPKLAWQTKVLAGQPVYNHVY
jgi:lipopolysaccharide transport system ATP-binding protein